MKYKEAIKQSMENFSKDEKTIFIGYNVSYGSKAYGTLTDISDSKKIETPVAENLMVGLAIGMSLEGFKPIVFFERHDFMLIALDAIINHLDKIEKMSEGQFKPKVIIRAVIGAKKPLDAGAQHTQNFSETFKILIKNFPIYEPKTPSETLEVYEKVWNSDASAMIIEKRDLYETEDGN